MKSIFLLAAFLLPATGVGQTTSFTGASDFQTWSDPLNWDNGIPADGYDVVLPDIEEPYSIMDLPNLELRSLTAIFGGNNGELTLEYPLTITGDLTIMPNQEAEARNSFGITVATSLNVGGNALLINCRWREGSATIGGDFYFRGDDESCAFDLHTPPLRRTTWNIGGDFWIPVCGWFDISRTDFVVNGDFVLNGNPLRAPLCEDATITVSGQGASLVSLPVPQDPYGGAIPSLIIDKNALEDVVAIDARELGFVRISNLAVHSGTVDLRTDARIDEIVVDHGAALLTSSSVGLWGQFLTANGRVSLAAPGMSLAMVGIGVGPSGSLLLAGGGDQPAWLGNLAVASPELYLSGNPGSVTIRDAAIGHCHASPEVHVLGCRDLGSNSGIVFDSASATGDDPAQPQPALRQNVPNPFNASTEIRCAVPDHEMATIRIFDLKGRLVRTLADRKPAANVVTAIWNGRDDDGAIVAAGAYFYQVSTPSFTASRKMLLLK